MIVVETPNGTDRHIGTEGWEISGAQGTVRLAGQRRQRSAPGRLIDPDRAAPQRATAVHVVRPPALDGSLEEFDASEPLALDHEDQYRRSEEAYAGPEEFSATAMLNWDADALYLGVDVVKAEAILRPDDAAPLRLDNEPDDLTCRRRPDLSCVSSRRARSTASWSCWRAEEGGIRVTPAGGSAGTPEMVTGAWQRTGAGYSLTLALTLPEWSVRSGDELAFDLLVNEMRPDRMRRAGQLVWTGGGGWVYLRGDRQRARTPRRAGAAAW